MKSLYFLIIQNKRWLNLCIYPLKTFRAIALMFTINIVLGDKKELISQKSLKKTYKPIENYEIPGEIAKLSRKKHERLINVL